jgi:hypothetical protein
VTLIGSTMARPWRAVVAVAVTISGVVAARPKEPPISEVSSRGRAVAGGRSA